MDKHGLEETIRGKVALLLEETMAKSWGIYIPQVQSDITDKLQNPLPQQLYLFRESSFPEAKQKFKAEFLKNQLRLNLLFLISERRFIFILRLLARLQSRSRDRYRDF